MAPTNRTTVVSRATLASCGLLGLALVSTGCERYEHHRAPEPSSAEPEAYEMTPEPERTPAPKPPGEDGSDVPTAPVAGTTQPQHGAAPAPQHGDATEMPIAPAASTAAPQSPTEEPEAAAEGFVESVDPAAVAALRRMGEYLRTLRSFEVRSSTQTDDVLDNGQLIQISSTATIDVQRPNGLRAEVTTDRDQRRYFYDGRTFSIESPQQGYYASVEAPGTLRELVDVASDRYGIDLPMVDLFLWGTDESEDGEQFTSAVDLGPSTVEGVETEHYAFREEGLDWQIWITRGDRPIPRMLVLTTTDDEARPSYQATYTWNLHATHAAGTFTFRPGASSHRIELQDQLAQADDLRERSATTH